MDLPQFEVGKGIWDNWDADMENDGPFITIVYEDSEGNIISNDATKQMPISADIKIYAGLDVLGPKDRLVFSEHYSPVQIILGSIYPVIRIPKERISSGIEAYYYKYGVVEVTISTPEQGNFSAKSDFIVLYE